MPASLEQLPEVRREMRDLTERLAEDRRWRHRLLWLLVTNIALTVIFIGLMAVAVLASLHNQHTLIECTTASTPGHVHECYDRGIANQGTAIASLERHQTATFVCVLAGHRGFDEIESCARAMETAAKP